MSVYQRIHREQRLRGYKYLGRPPLPDEPPAISAKITVHGHVKSIAADTPDELLHKLSRVLAKEGIDVWAILTKKARSH